MGFRSEFKAMNKKTADSVDVASIEAAAKEKDDALAAKKTGDTPDPDADLIQPFMDGQSLNGDEVDEPVATIPDKIPPPKPEAKKTKVKLNGKEFETMEEALEYAAEVDRENERQAAYLKGIQEATPKAEAKPVVKVSEVKAIAEKMFEDPEAALEELMALVEKKADKIVETRDTQKTQAQIQAETVKNTWDNFYKENADLAEWQDEVNQVFQKERSRLENVPADKALAEIAEKSRAYIASVKERALPKTILSNSTVTTPAGGSATATTTKKPTTENKVSFASQVRSTNKRTLMQDDV